MEPIKRCVIGMKRLNTDYVVNGSIGWFGRFFFARHFDFGAAPFFATTEVLTFLKLKKQIINNVWTW